MMCYYCHKKIVGDYSIITEKGKTKHLHPLCAEKLRKLQERAKRAEREEKKQKPLYNFLDSA
jgi:hypothetical protein